MGWRGTLRSIRAASNRAARESEKRENARVREANRLRNEAVKELQKINRTVDKVLKQARDIDAQLTRDPVRAMELDYFSDIGFQAKPFAISSELITGNIAIISKTDPTDDGAFSPPNFTTPDLRITPLDCLPCRWGTIFAIFVENFNESRPLKTPWINTRTRSSSPLYLLDQESGSYHYPIGASITGEVLAGFPKVFCVAFAPATQPTNHFRLQFSEIPSTSNSDSISCWFNYTASNLPSSISDALSEPSIESQVDQFLSKEISKAKGGKRKTSGCVVAFLVVIVLSLIASFVSQLNPNLTSSPSPPASKAATEGTAKDGHKKSGAPPSRDMSDFSAEESSENGIVVPNPSDVSEPKGASAPALQPAELPTPIRKWTSTDGRTLLGSITELDVTQLTATIRRADGEEFPNFDLKKFSEEDQIFLLGRTLPVQD